MKKVMAVFILITLQVTLGLGTATAGSNLHFGYLDGGSFVAGDYLWNGELRPITSDASAFQIQGNAEGSVVDPFMLFLGIAFEGSGYTAPTITEIISNGSTNSTTVQGTFQASLNSNSVDAYSLLGLGSYANNSQNWTNWSGAYSSLIAPMPSNGSFGIFQYNLYNTGLVGGQVPVGVTFSGELPAGTFIFGLAQFNNTYYSTPFTETGMTPQSVPEPTTMLLLGFGLVGLAGVRRKFKK